MATVSVTYKAPQGESKVCELFGYTFYDGKPVEIEDNKANEAALKKLQNHALFDMSDWQPAAAGQDEQPAAEPAADEADAEDGDGDGDDDGKSKKKKTR